MFTDFFGKADRISEAMMWHWAAEHPYLFTLIKVMQPYLDVVIVVAGISLVRNIFQKRRG